MNTENEFENMSDYSPSGCESQEEEMPPRPVNRRKRKLSEIIDELENLELSSSSEASDEELSPLPPFILHPDP